MTLYLDLSEFLAVPTKTGIQRVTGELCRQVPRDSTVPVRVLDNALVALPPALLAVISRYFESNDDGAIDEIGRLGSQTIRKVVLEKPDSLVVTEIFGFERARFYSSLEREQRDRCRFLVHDLLPMTHPEFFPVWMPAAMFPYFYVAQQAGHCGFVSDCTRSAYYGRFKRSDERGGVVLAPGSDSLGTRVRRPSLDRSLIFTAVGTIEPRKNHALILDAFEPMLRQVPGLRLRFVGKMGWVGNKFSERVVALSRDPNSGFEFLPAESDAGIRRLIEESRATISVSVAEGYGLPAVESLWLGTPVIASRTIPSVQGLGPAGVHFVEALNAVNLRRAVLAFLDRDYANRKIEETVDLPLPTWQSFAQGVVEWCHGLGGA